jgi:hypothetical protein
VNQQVKLFGVGLTGGEAPSDLTPRDVGLETVLFVTCILNESAGEAVWCRGDV